MDLNSAFKSGGLTLSNPYPGLSFSGQAPQNLTFGPATPVNIPQAFNSGGLQLNYSPPSQGVLGASTTSAPPAQPTNTGGGDSQLTQFQKMLSSGGLNPSQQSQYNALMQQQQNAANSGNSALLSQLNTQYDQNAANLQSQLGDLSTQKGNSLNELNTTYQGLSDQTNTQKTQANQNLQDQIAAAGSQAKNTQEQNRNTLRALGILNSTAAGELLSKPLTAFDQQRAQLQTQTNQRLSQLDDFMNNQAAVHANAVKSLEDQYGSLVGKIQSDLRFNDRQRADAIQSANSALQQRMAEIQSSLFNYQTQVQTAKQQAAMQLAQIQAYQNPNADMSGILGSIFNPDQGQQSQTVGIAQDPNKNNSLLSG